MNTATEPTTATRRSPAEVYDVVDGVRLHRLTSTSEDQYPVPIDDSPGPSLPADVQNTRYGFSRRNSSTHLSISECPSISDSTP